MGKARNDHSQGCCSPRHYFPVVLTSPLIPLCEGESGHSLFTGLRSALISHFIGAIPLTEGVRGREFPILFSPPQEQYSFHASSVLCHHRGGKGEERLFCCSFVSTANKIARRTFSISSSTSSSANRNTANPASSKSCCFFLSFRIVSSK